MARPEEYKKEYVEKVDEYLTSRQDEEVQVVKQANSEKGYEMYDNKLKVKLPTKEGFARFIDVSEKSLYNWEKQYPEFLQALRKVMIEQKERLQNMGLSGHYNSTIAKLILSSNHGMIEKTETAHSFENEEAKQKSAKLVQDYLGNTKADRKQS